jgi:two-component system, OmpR family, response regulator MprA
MEPMTCVVIADDDRAIRESLERALSLEGYVVVTAADGTSCLSAVAAREPQLLILDVSMPSVDGITVCRVLRSERNRLPILMLTARTETTDRVAGLDAGADDYLTKPFELSELLARMRALLRRSEPNKTEAAESHLTICDLKLDASARQVWRANQEIELSKTEFDLLELLVRNQGIVLDHSTIYDRIWGYDFGPESKNLAVYIGYLRRKMDDGHDVKLLHTIRGVGYSVRV